MKRIFLSLFFVPFALIGQQQADSIPVKQLKELVIKGRRLSDISRMPTVSGTQILAGKKNEVVHVAGMNANLAEKTGRQIFAKVPGVFVYDMDGSGNQVNISTRGLDPHRGWEFNIRKNGVITNSDMYGYPASHYSMPMEAVERIELVRGTGSLQYGAQFGGMINYIAKRADTTKKFSFENISTAGSFGLLSSYNSFGGKIGKVEYMAYYQKRVSNGYRDNARSESDAQALMLTWAVTSNLKVKGEVARSTYLFRIPGPLTDAMFNENPRMATRSRNYFNPDIYVPSISIDWAITPQTRLLWTTSAVLGSRNSVMFDRPANVVDAIDPVSLTYAPRQVDIDNFKSFTSELKALHRYKFLGGNHLVTAGIQVFDNDLHRRNLGRGTTGTDYDLTVTDGVFSRDMHFKTKNVAMFLENSFKVTDRLSVNPGVRLEQGVSDMSGTISYYDPTNLPNSISHKFPLYGINAQYTLKRSQNIYAGWSQSYRPVIFKEIIPTSTYEVVDKNLKDASGYTIEAGYRGQLEGFNWDVSVFQLQYNNRLGTLAGRDAANNYFLFRSNIGNSLTNGAEVFGEYVATIGKYGLSLFTSTALFNARYTDAQIRSGEDNIDIRGNRVESVPSVITRNGATLRFPRGSFGVLYSYTGESFADALNTETPSSNGAVGLVPAYALLDFNFSHNLASQLTLKLNVNNATNEHYFTKRPSFYPGPGVWSSDGRSLIASVILKI